MYTFTSMPIYSFTYVGAVGCTLKYFYPSRVFFYTIFLSLSSFCSMRLFVRRIHSSLLFTRFFYSFSIIRVCTAVTSFGFSFSFSLAILQSDSLSYSALAPNSVDVTNSLPLRAQYKASLPFLYKKKTDGYRT